MVNGIKHLIEVQSQAECCSENVNQVSGPKRFNSFRIIWRRVWIYFFRCILFIYVNTSVICASPSIPTSNCVDSENKISFTVENSTDSLWSMLVQKGYSMQNLPKSPADIYLSFLINFWFSEITFHEFVHLDWFTKGWALYTINVPIKSILVFEFQISTNFFYLVLQKKVPWYF